MDRRKSSVKGPNLPVSLTRVCLGLVLDPETRSRGMFLPPPSPDGRHHISSTGSCEHVGCKHLFSLIANIKASKSKAAKRAAAKSQSVSIERVQSRHSSYLLFSRSIFDQVSPPCCALETFSVMVQGPEPGHLAGCGSALFGRRPFMVDLVPCFHTYSK